MLNFLKRRRAVPLTTYHDSRWLSQLQEKSREEKKSNAVVVDLGNVERIDSRELGELVKIHLRLRQIDRFLVLENAHGGVLEVLELTRMNRLMEVREASVAVDQPAAQLA